MLIPLLHRVIVKPVNVEEADETIRRAKAAGIHIELDKREQAAVEVGTIVSLGDTAFVDYKTNVFPVVGDKVYYAKYAGKTLKDADGTEYLCLNDEDCTAIIKD
jgi:co-chaperonin GroES (HSP10)